MDNLFFSSPDETENFPVKEKSLDWLLPPAPLISEIPDIQELEEEIESYKLLGEGKMPRMLTSNLKIINEDTNCISPTRKFHFPYNIHEQDYLNLGRSSNNDRSHIAGKLMYGSSQKYKNHVGNESPPAKSSPGDTKLHNAAEDGEGASAFQKRLSRTCDNVHECDYADGSLNLNSHISLVKLTQTKISKEKSWECSNNKQKLQYSTNKFKANDAFSASGIGKDMFKAPSFPAASQPLDIQDRNFVICAPTVAPIKALCSQRFDDWKEKFGPIGLTCKELTGDTVMDDLFEIQHANIIMTTPEKWDSMTRKWRDNSFIQLVRLFLIDEVHVIKDENRGPTLEVVVSRMKTVQSLSRALESASPVPVRFVAVSATIPNAEDIAEWLSDGERPAVCLKMDESHRPVKLQKVVLGFPCSSNQTEFKFDLALNYKVYSVIRTYSDQKPTLVFCATRKGVQQAASVLVKDAKFIITVEQKLRLQKSAYSIRDSKLKVTTSTLAMGVNLPAHLVIIKSTMHYTGGMFEEYSETDILQMIGRAGRPQFDTTATAVIMTRLSTREKYVQMLACNDTVESSLHRHLIEHLNAEIVLHTITDVNVALDWIRSTLLYIRALKNPSHYGFVSGLNKDGIEAKLQDLIKMDEDVNFKPTEAGRLMAWYYITFETVKKFCAISGKETLSDLISMISSCNEFLDVQLRISEKRTLNTLNKDPNRITIRNERLSDFVAVQEKKFAVLLNSVILAKCFKCKLWENSQHISKQLDKIGISLSNTMVNAGLTSFKKIEEANARELELILNRHPPFGTQIKEAVMYLPKYELEVEQIERYSDTKAEILVTIVLRNFEQLQTKRTVPDFHYASLIIGDADNQVVFKHKVMDSVLLKSGNWVKKIDVKRALISDDLSINLISSDYVGLDIHQKFTVFYLGSRKFVNQTAIKRSPETGISHPEYSDKATAATSSKGMTTCKKPGNRECHHHCKNKHSCGHDCCKIGVAQKQVRESVLSSYLSDLKSRDAVSSLPPAKRLKIQMNKSQNVDLKEFGFIPRPSLSSVSRSEYLNIPDLPILEQRNQHEIYGKVQQGPSEYCDKDFPGWDCCTTSNEETTQTVMFSRHAGTPGNHRAADADKSTPPDASHSNLELGSEVWEDFDDESLIEVMSFSADAEKMAVSAKKLMPKFYVSPGEAERSPHPCTEDTFPTSPSPQALHFSLNRFGDTRDSSLGRILCHHLRSQMFIYQIVPCPTLGRPQWQSSLNKLEMRVNLQERRQPTLSPVIERICFAHSKKIPQSPNFKEVDIFIGNSGSKKEIDLSKYYPDDAAEEMKALVGIFNGIF
ncbi:Probable ATP-dependent DNA helicase HFM1 [Apodemus speciosus]|uniref:DNA 3'-5' helicase n=1 Tax=Apodemus speciosus TaxID=105296 RepID=A0ABQ0ET40_APOSI